MREPTSPSIIDPPGDGARGRPPDPCPRTPRRSLSADLAVPDECRRLVRSAIEHLGTIDFLVHSASNFRRSPLSKTTSDLWDDAIHVNVRAGFLLAREAAPILSRRSGRIVLISDLMAHHPARSYLAHSVSKAAVEGLVRALAVELAPGVSVNGVAPGTVMVPQGTSIDQAARYARKTLLGRNGDPDDIARTVLFLCSGPRCAAGARYQT